MGAGNSKPLLPDDAVLGACLLQGGIPELLRSTFHPDLFMAERRPLARALLVVSQRVGSCPLEAVKEEMGNQGAGIREITALAGILAAGALPDELADLFDALQERERRRVVAERPQAEIARDGDDFTFSWPSLSAEIHLTRLRDAGEGVQGELSIILREKPLHWGRLNLASTSAREGLVTKLNRVDSKIPWRALLEEVCRKTSEQLRASSPIVQLVPAAAAPERRLVDKLVLDGETNVIFGDGGAGKSFLALALAIAVASGKGLPAGLTPRRTGPVLLLDWESCLEEHQERLAGLLAGLGISGPVPIFYRRMIGTLADEASVLRAEMARLGVIFVIVDSFGPACGPEPEGADAVIRTLNALRSLGEARMALAHVNKIQADQRGPARPFGSVYVMNLPRNVWEVRNAKEEERDNILTLGAYHRKTNRGRLLPPFGLRFEFSQAATQIRSADLTADPGLKARAGIGFGILAALRSGARTTPELTEELGEASNSVLKAIQRLEKSGKILQLEKPAKGRPAKWGLPA